MGNLTKLKQTTTVRAYQEQFEVLANKTQNHPETFFISCFISGLKDEIQPGVLMFKPTSITQAIGLAKLQETSIEAITNKTRLGTKSEGILPFSVNRSQVGNGGYVRKELSKDLEEKKAKGLCFKCNERYTKGHVCKKKQLYVMEGGEDGEEDDQLPVLDEDKREDEEQLSGEELQIFLNALTGTISYRTMKVRGNVKKHLIIILIDSESTHNFLSPAVAKRSNIETENTNSLPVSVDDGTRMLSTAMCKDFQWEMQGTNFQADMRVLQLKGCDMVLDIQWLATLGPVKWDFKHLSMEFHLNGRKHVLRGGKRNELKVLSPEKMQKLLHKQPQGAIAQLYLLQADCLVREEKTPLDLAALLSNFADIFQERKDLPPPRSHDHCIPLKPGTEPTNVRPYRYPYFQKTEIEKQVKDMLTSGLIRPSVSPYSSPVLLVKKKDGTWRMCVDYRALNNATVKDKFPIPVIDELLDELCGAQYFSKLDLRSGYHQIRVHSSDIDKMAFRTHDGHYEFLVMPFGLTNAPSTFQSLMNEVFRPFLRKFIVVFFYDILVYSGSWGDHLQHSQLTLQLLRQHHLFAKMSKCVFGKDEVEYLEHLVSAKGVFVEPTKLQAIKPWPTPSTIKELRGFLGLTGYYRRFIQYYGRICSPLHYLLKKDSFVWSSTATTVFLQLKATLLSTPVLALPDYSKAFVLESDASGTGLGAVLMQDRHPIAYWSKGISTRDQALSTYEKELMAVVLAVLILGHYLLGGHFLIRTDHQSLKYLLEQRMGTPFQQTWVTKLLGFDYTITYKCRKDNQAANALSRKEELVNTADAIAMIHALSCISTGWLAEVKLSWSEDTDIQQLILDLQQGQAHAGYAWDHDILTYHGRYKSENVKYPSLLQPLPIPNRVWSDISMDFIEGLPNSLGKTVIFVVVDRLSKYGHFMALSYPYTAADVAKVFFDQVFKLHGLPSTIVSDRDAVFTSHFWHKLFTLQGCKLCLSTAYHPQTNGQTEILNKCLENYLRCMSGGCPRQWAKWLSLAEWWYNTTNHSATKTTPYFAVYGQEPPDHTFFLSTPSSVAVVDNWEKERVAIIKTLREHLTQAQQRMKHYADKGRSEREFEIGDWVLKRVGSVAYKLELPTTAKIHPVFHVSLLKKKIGTNVLAHTTLPPVGLERTLQLEPMAILDRRMLRDMLEQATNYVVELKQNVEELKQRKAELEGNNKGGSQDERLPVLTI
ncbi:uncharacterized protein LOC114260736 [Camellia sinensis]|uniref:uncharacterized protein LOC114260736 n=1 Tax=Camellia sinensis TaxID=4442 RepID=UPI0010357738|nr:uncharacterized protein LOC114260736 [Camellia sinensis]